MVSSGTSGCEHETEKNINTKVPASGSLKVNVKSKKTLNRGSLKGGVPLSITIKTLKQK
jgi:predicted component of type VI protein secretion system